MFVDVDEVVQVIGLELALLTPEVRKSRAHVDALLDPDFREIGASGRLWTRVEMVAALSEEFDGPDELIPAADFTGMAIGPGLILLTCVSDPEGRAARRSSLWRRSGRTWRLLHHQGTLLRQD